MKKGFILKSKKFTLGNYYVVSCIGGIMEYTSDPKEAWFTESRDLATAMSFDLMLNRKNEEFEILDFTHGYSGTVLQWLPVIK